MFTTEPSRIREASLSNAGIVLQLKHPSVTAMLKAGRVIMALTTLMYGPVSLSQVLCFKRKLQKIFKYKSSSEKPY